MKKLLAVGIMSAALGAIGAGVLTAPDGRALETATDTNDGDTPDSTRDCDGASRRRHRVVRAMVGASAEAIGISREELRGELADGGSIDDVAEAHGVDPSDVEAALLADVERRVAEAVERGVLDADRAADILEAAPDRIHDFVTKQREGRPDEA